MNATAHRLPTGIEAVNALEQRILTADGERDGLLWEQAARVVAILKSGTTQRALAAQWINARTGNPYTHGHVGRVARVVGAFKSQPKRPRFQDAYNAIANSRVQQVSAPVMPSAPIDDAPPAGSGKRTLTMPDRSPEAQRERLDRIRELAAHGYAPEQIAAAVGLGIGRVKHLLRTHVIDCPAARTLGRATRRIDANRFLDHLVDEAESLTANVTLIDLAMLDRSRLHEWIAALKDAASSLRAFIGQLSKEGQRHVQQQQSTDHPDVKNSPGADSADADAGSARRPAEIPQSPGGEVRG